MQQWKPTVDSISSSTFKAQTNEPNQQELEVVVNNVNNFVQNIQRSTLVFLNLLGAQLFKVYDTQTDELIREIPSEEMQRISEAIAAQVSEGLLVKINI